MASGHANRANRPNTWLHRPTLRREVLTCQRGAVHTWHIADQSATPALRPLLTQSGHFTLFCSFNMDLPSRERWYDYSRARDKMLEATDTDFGPGISCAQTTRSGRASMFCRIFSA